MARRARRLRRELPADLPIQIMRRFSQTPTGLHGHPFFELVIITGGRGMHFTDAGEFPIVAGDVFVISGPRAHGYRQTENLVLTNILFHPERLPMPMQDIRALPGYHVLFTLEPHYRARHRFESRLHLGTKELARVDAWVEMLDEELRTQAPGYRFAATALFMQIVGYLSRCYTDDQAPSARPLVRIGETISYLEENYAQPIRLCELESVAHMSKSGLLRAFRQALGVSPIEYLIRLRVRRAAEMLGDEELTISEIAYRVGFSDSNYFARQFRAIMGSSPRQFRSRAGPSLS